ncbi:hypothetical protein ACFQ3W_23255 [Paenibacillus puldeungensis]|uniref:Uncharacterized protein n=1 Tax=Paenibacillus puldeungensis TaxID=696536 RepID=A0ABW3S403_9BACL
MPRGLSNEDYSYVKLYILLPLILSAFERDKHIAEQVFRTPRPYVTLLDTAIKRVEDDHKEVRRKFRLLGLKVYGEKRTGEGIEARYLCRGYNYEFSMLWSLISAESSILMEKYLGLDIFKYIDPAIPGDGEQYELPNDVKQ